MTCTANRHGTDDAYINARCRCPEARDDHRQKRFRRRKRRAFYGPSFVDSTYTAQRLRSLAVMSWSIDNLAPLCGIDRARLALLRQQTTPKVSLRTHNVIAMLHSHLAGRRGPSHLTAVFAERAGWTLTECQFASDLHTEHDADGDSPVDWVKVDRFLSGDNGICLTKAEKQDGYRHLREQGISHSRAAKQLHVSGTTATLYREQYEEIRATA